MTSDIRRIKDQLSHARERADTGAVRQAVIALCTSVADILDLFAPPPESPQGEKCPTCGSDHRHEFQLGCRNKWHYASPPEDGRKQMNNDIRRRIVNGYASDDHSGFADLLAPPESPPAEKVRCTCGSASNWIGDHSDNCDLVRSLEQPSPPPPEIPQGEKCPTCGNTRDFDLCSDAFHCPPGYEVHRDAVTGPSFVSKLPEPDGAEAVAEKWFEGLCSNLSPFLPIDAVHEVTIRSLVHVLRDFAAAEVAREREACVATALSVMDDQATDHYTIDLIADAIRGRSSPPAETGDPR